MKVRSLIELQDKLDADIQWRKKELIEYKFIVEEYKRTTQLVPLIRGGIALGYAHWEGFIKIASSLYVNYISTIKIPYSYIQTNFVTLSYLKRLNKAKSIQECLDLVDELLFDTTKPCKINDKNIIDTKSNLNFNVLNEIISLLGLDISFFRENENFLNKKLVEPRNDIAHGTYRDVSYDDYEIVYSNIIPLMEHYKTLIENMSVEKKYRR